jgi:hypothetical protein
MPDAVRHMKLRLDGDFAAQAFFLAGENVK